MIAHYITVWWCSNCQHRAMVESESMDEAVSAQMLVDHANQDGCDCPKLKAQSLRIVLPERDWESARKVFAELHNNP